MSGKTEQLDKLMQFFRLDNAARQEAAQTQSTTLRASQPAVVETMEDDEESASWADVEREAGVQPAAA
jgi:hypothetical protein